MTDLGRDANCAFDIGTEQPKTQTDDAIGQAVKGGNGGNDVDTIKSCGGEWHSQQPGQQTDAQGA